MTEILPSKIIQKCKHCACSSKIFKLTMLKCSAKQPSKCYVRFQGLTAQITMSTIFWNETICSILPKLEPTRSSKTVVPVYQSTQCHIPEYRSLPKHYSIVLWQEMQLHSILNILTSKASVTNAFWKHNWRMSQTVFSSNEMSHFR